MELASAVRMIAQNLDDKQLVVQLVSLVRAEREALETLLCLLREMDRRRLFLDLGYSSLFAFCLGKLGFTEHESQLRIQATRLTGKFPEVGAAIGAGRLSLSVVARAQSHFRRLEIQDTPVPLDIQREIIESLMGLSVKEAERRLAEQFPGEPPREKIQFLHDRKVKIEFVLDLEIWEKFDELRSIRTHVNPSKRLDLMIRDLLDVGWKKWHPLARAERSPRTCAVASQQPEVSA